MDGAETCESRTISKEVFKKLFILYAVGRFQKGVYGKKRLHKIIYIFERESDIKPFAFKKHHYGQYSEPLDDVKDQLLSMGYMQASPLKTISDDHSGNIFEISDKDLQNYYSLIMEKIKPSLTRRLDDVIAEYGYLPEDKLIELVYSFPEFIHAGFDSIIFPEQIPERVEVADLSEEDIEELEISLNPRLINLFQRIDNSFEESEFDTQRVKKIVELV